MCFLHLHILYHGPFNWVVKMGDSMKPLLWTSRNQVRRIRRKSSILSSYVSVLPKLLITDILFLSSMCALLWYIHTRTRSVFNSRFIKPQEKSGIKIFHIYTHDSRSHPSMGSECKNLVNIYCGEKITVRKIPVGGISRSQTWSSIYG